MQKKLHHIVLITAVAFFGSVTAAFSQDSGLIDVEVTDLEKDRLDREKIISSPGEGDTRYVGKSPVIAPKDSVAAAPGTTSVSTPALLKFKAEKPAPSPKPTVEKQSKNQDDSILSFNFLYYIIEKYKLQDIVE
jgi:hypothetical protein